MQTHATSQLRMNWTTVVRGKEVSVLGAEDGWETCG